MKNIVLTIEYDGTNYHGWQKQNNSLGIQDVIGNALYKVTGENINLIGSSRTDAGVHALFQVANFYTNTQIPVERLPFAINSILPKDIVIVDAFEANQEFHSRYSAKKKRYKYIIYNRRFPMPIKRNYSWHISKELEIEKMIYASKYLIGTHDFSSFKASGSEIKNNIRTIYEILIQKQEDEIILEIEADGFLYNMVRIITGTLVYVGLGKINAEEILNILESKDRTKAGITAPPQGLYLLKIYY